MHVLQAAMRLILMESLQLSQKPLVISEKRLIRYSGRYDIIQFVNTLFDYSLSL